MYQMDGFVKKMLIGSIIGAIAVTIWRTKNPNFNEQLNQKAIERMEADAAEVEDDLWCYGGIFNHLEFEKEYLAWSDSNDNYVAQVLFTGDHHTDPRLMVVRAESDNRVVQVVMLRSYEEHNKMIMQMQQSEVPD